MEHYRVVKNTEEGTYFLVFTDLIKRESNEPGKFEILKENDATARQILEEFAGAPIIAWDDLVCESEHYLYYASLRPHFWDWRVFKK